MDAGRCGAGAFEPGVLSNKEMAGGHGFSYGNRPPDEPSVREGDEPMFRRLRKRFRYGYVRLLRSPGASREIAAGVALGLFIAMLPIPGIQTVVTLAVVELIRRVTGVRLSRVGALAGVWLNNPVTLGPIHALAFFVGRPFADLMWPGAPLSGEGAGDASRIIQALSEGAPYAIVSATLGGVLLGIVVALLGYYVTLRLVVRYQGRRAARRARVTRVAKERADEPSATP